MRCSNTILPMLTCACLLAACSGGATPEEYNAWLNDPANGLARTRDINGLQLTAKMLPAPYVACNELRGREGVTTATRDSLIAELDRSVRFILSIRSAPSKRGGDVMMRGVSSYQELTERAMQMSFGLDDRITLRADGRTYRPALVSMDQDYGMSTARNVVVVFADSSGGTALRDARVYDLVYDDAVFATGISHFRFERSALADAPSLTF